LLFNSFGLALGIFGIFSGNDTSKANILRMLGIAYLIYILIFVGFSFSIAMVLVLAVPVLFITGAQRNYTDYKKSHEQQQNGRDL